MSFQGYVQTPHRSPWFSLTFYLSKSVRTDSRCSVRRGKSSVNVQSRSQPDPRSAEAKLRVVHSGCSFAQRAAKQNSPFGQNSLVLHCSMSALLWSFSASRSNCFGWNFTSKTTSTYAARGQNSGENLDTARFVYRTIRVHTSVFPLASRISTWPAVRV
jgi:hypothetical protein